MVMIFLPIDIYLFRHLYYLLNNPLNNPLHFLLNNNLSRHFDILNNLFDNLHRYLNNPLPDNFCIKFSMIFVTFLVIIIIPIVMQINDIILLIFLDIYCLLNWLSYIIFLVVGYVILYWNLNQSYLLTLIILSHHSCSHIFLYQSTSLCVNLDIHLHWNLKQFIDDSLNRDLYNLLNLYNFWCLNLVSASI